MEAANDNYPKPSKFLRMAAVASAVLMSASVTACNTVEGVGEDIQAVGDGIDDSADQNKNY